MKDCKMVDQGKTVEQLWYMWSDVGLDTIRAGFRIRAASEGLQDIRSVRVQNLDYYQRYFLPQNTVHSTIPANIAPICLSLINTGEERILVHKTYTGKDGIGRYGAFFIHLLAGLPEEFSAMDAILLWRSEFWQDSDRLLDRRSTSLRCEPLEDLKKARRDIALDISKVKQYLPYVIQAYLTKKSLQKLYIAGSDDTIAQLIFGLMYSLPEQLWKNLTFSTYEHDVTEAITEIVGTCWLSDPQHETNPQVKSLLYLLLPDKYYQEKLAINCYTGTSSPLEKNPLAEQCAQDAGEYFLLCHTMEFKEFEQHLAREKLDFVRKNPAFRQLLEFENLAQLTKFIEYQEHTFGEKNPDLEKLLEFEQRIKQMKETFLEKQPDFEILFQFEEILNDADDDPDLDVKKFLWLYDTVTNPSPSNVIRVLTPRSRFDYAHSAKMLMRGGYQRAILHLATDEPGFWNRYGQKGILNLSKRRAEIPRLADALFELAEYATSEAVSLASKGVVLVRDSSPAEVIAQAVASFKIIIDMIYCTAPPKVDLKIWLSFLSELLKIEHIFVFFRKDWNINLVLWNCFDKEAITRLRKQSMDGSALAQALSQIAQSAIPFALDTAREEIALIHIPIPENVLARKQAALESIIDLMFCAAPPEVELKVWLFFLSELLKIEHIFEFFKRYWSIYVDLMRGWLRTGILPFSEENYKWISPLLPDSWVKWGDFLAIDLPIFWNEMLTGSLLISRSELSEEIARNLELNHHPLIESLLRDLSQQRQWWDTTGNLFEKLVAGQYGKKLPLLSILLDSPMGRYGNNAERLMQGANLSASEKAPVLKVYGQRYLPLFDVRSSPVLKMFDELVRNHSPKEKMDVLFGWLESRLLSDWFGLPSIGGQQHLEAVLFTAQLNSYESGEFFKNFGQKYIRLYPYSSILLNLFSQYTQSKTPQRIQLLQLWLSLQLSLETLEQVLQAANLTATDRKIFLERYGELYISRYPQSAVLVNYLQEYQNQLWLADIDIFRRSASPEEPSSTEKFLRFLCNYSEYIRLVQLKCDWCTWCHVGAFVRKPSTIKEWQGVAQSVGLFLSIPDIPVKTHDKLINKLAAACIEDELVSVINIIQSTLILKDRLLVLYKIAESVGQKRNARRLLASCIQFVLGFKAFDDEKEKRDYFVRTFLNTLLWNTDRKTFEWLNTQAKEWEPPEVYSQWQKYQSERSSSSEVDEFSRFERIRLWWERTVAFLRLRKALRNEKAGPQTRVATDYMTTLINNDKETQDEWWYDIDEVLITVGSDKKLQWQHYKSQLTEKPAALPPNLKWHERIKPWWERTISFMQVRFALLSKNTGRIVRVTTDNMNILATYDKKVSDKWRTQIDMAFNFFIACVDANESTDEAKEQAIVSVGDAITERPAPRLNMHEKRRYEAAKRYVASDFQSTKQQMLATLLPVPMPGTGQTQRR